MATPASQLQLAQRLTPKLEALANELGTADMLWASGYLAGMAAARDALSHPAEPMAKPPHPADQSAREAAAVSAPPAEALTLTIWYGSQTGNARGVAEALAAQAKARGYQVELSNLAEVKPRHIDRVRLLLLVVSTHGDGEPPEDAEALYQWLHGKRASRLETLQYAVFGLGDSSYPHFCKTGHDFHRALGQLGATALLACAEADVDFNQAADDWREQALKAVEPLLDQTPASTAAATPHLQVVPAATQIGRDTPVDAELLEVAPLTVAPATRSVHHVEIDIDGRNLSYQAGDALGIWPQNPAETVAEIIQTSGLSASELVSVDGQQLSLEQWLGSKREITQLSRRFIQDYNRFAESQTLAGLLADTQALIDWISQRQVADLLTEFPIGLDASQLVELLRPLTPRLYSIASSPLVTPDEVHLTVATVGGPSERGLRAGAASWWLNQSLQPGNSLPVWIEPNPRFRLPEDSNRPILMIGAGTGIAPFRAFVQEREASEARGDNWLLFGNRFRRADFLYQLEWQRHLKNGSLRRLTPVFSRDGEQRRYVQHALLEQAKDIYAAIQEGAHIYVCGATAMGAEVHQALLHIIQQHAGQSDEQAEEALRALRAEKRYQKDVY